MEDPIEAQPQGAGETPKSELSQDPSPAAWLARGIEDVYYQREAQVTWWTILGGIAVGALVTQLADVISQVQAGRWWLVLYFVATALIISLSWVQTTWGTLVVRWPISVVTALLSFFGGMSQSILSLQVTKPSAWLVAAFMVALTSVLYQTYFQASGAWVAFGPEYAARLKSVVWMHGAFGGAALAGALLLRRYPGPTHEMLWGFFALSVMLAATWLQDRGMKMERSMLHIP